MNAEMNDLLIRVETRVRQLILKHRELQAKKKSLEEEIAALHQEIDSLEEKNGSSNCSMTISRWPNTLTWPTAALRICVGE